MKTIILAFILLLIPSFSYAANAIAVIGGATSSGPNVNVIVIVEEDSNTVSFAASFQINFARSANQVNADIKQRVRDELLRFGVDIPVNQIYLFGGAQ